MLKTKSGFPQFVTIKATLSAIGIFTLADREEKNAPLTDAACQAVGADLLKKRPLSLVDPTLPSLCLLPAIYVSILLKKGGSVWWWGGCIVDTPPGGLCLRLVVGFVGAEKTKPSPARLLEC